MQVLDSISEAMKPIGEAAERLGLELELASGPEVELTLVSLELSILQLAERLRAIREGR